MVQQKPKLPAVDRIDNISRAARKIVRALATFSSDDRRAVLDLVNASVVECANLDDAPENEPILFASEKSRAVGS